MAPGLGQRRLGRLVLAVLLAGLGLGALIQAGSPETLAQLADRWRVIQVAALVYGCLAVAAAVGFWRGKLWGLLAFYGWAAIVVLIPLWLPPALHEPAPSWSRSALWIGSTGVTTLLVIRYARRLLG